MARDGIRGCYPQYLLHAVKEASLPMDNLVSRPDITTLAWQYRDILLDYLASPREQDQTAVFDFGYQAALQHFDLKQIIELHHIVLLNLFAGARMAKETVRLAGELLQEVTGIHTLLCLRAAEPG